MPPSLIDRANAILKQLEHKHADNNGNAVSHAVKQLSAPQLQLSIFDIHTETFQNIRQVLEVLDVNRLTPVEALLKLNEIKNLLK